MKILVLKETNPNEKRIAISPDLVEKYVKYGFEVFIEKDAGLASGIKDIKFIDAGAKLVNEINEVITQIDIIISVQRILNSDEIAPINKSCFFISMLNHHFNKDPISQLINKGIKPIAMEMIPRITRAQTMDVLSSQSNIAGYVAVIEAAYRGNKIMPMMITAAGTIAASKVMVIGAGVAGLQAIATAKRLGAIVCAFDVRAAAKEQVQSLGAKFIEVASSSNNETASGYAKEMDEEYKKRQEKAIYDSIINQDIVILTALIPGKKAPILISKNMVENMKKGSLIIDLAANSGGNCELTQCNKIIDINGVTIVGYENFPSLAPLDASKLYAKNIYNFIELLIDKDSKQLISNIDDEIVKAALLTKI